MDKEKLGSWINDIVIINKLVELEVLTPENGKLVKDRISTDVRDFLCVK